MSNHIFNFIFKNFTIVVKLLHLLLICILKFLFKKGHDFARLIFVFNKFQEMGTKSIFLSFKITFQLVIFQYLKHYLTKIVHWPHCEIIIESS